MSKRHLIAASIAVMLLAAGCKKADLENQEAAQTAAASPVDSQWKSVSNWQAKKTGDYSTYQNTIQDSTISTAIASEGLVLVYAKTAGSVELLPYQQKDNNGSLDWYYQVSEGRIMISADVHGSATMKQDAQFTYLAFSASQLQDLESRGVTKTDLMQLSYDKAQNLTK